MANNVNADTGVYLHQIRSFCVKYNIFPGGLYTDERTKYDSIGTLAFMIKEQSLTTKPSKSPMSHSNVLYLGFAFKVCVLNPDLLIRYYSMHTFYIIADTGSIGPYLLFRSLDLDLRRRSLDLDLRPRDLDRFRSRLLDRLRSRSRLRSRLSAKKIYILSVSSDTNKVDSVQFVFPETLLKSNSFHPSLDIDIECQIFLLVVNVLCHNKSYKNRRN